MELLGRNWVGMLEDFTIEGCCELQGDIVKVYPELIIHSGLQINGVEPRNVLWEKIEFLPNQKLVMLAQDGGFLNTNLIQLTHDNYGV